MTEDVRDLLGTVWERGTLDSPNYAFGKITTVEGGLPPKPPRVIMTCAGSAQGGRPPRLPLGLDELHAEWTPLAVPDALPFYAPSSCLRCRRTNFGPCISATCVDLQAVDQRVLSLVPTKEPT